MCVSGLNFGEYHKLVGLIPSVRLLFVVVVLEVSTVRIGVALVLGVPRIVAASHSRIVF